MFRSISPATMVDNGNRSGILFPVRGAAKLTILVPTRAGYTQGEPTMQSLSRRQLLQAAGTSFATLALAPLTAAVRAADPAGFTLPKLPYAFDALEPYI